MCNTVDIFSTVADFQNILVFVYKLSFSYSWTSSGLRQPKITAIYIDAKMTWGHALNLEHAQNALCLFADAHWLEWIGHAHSYACVHTHWESLF